MKPGVRHVVANRFPARHAWDFLSLAQILARGDMSDHLPLSFAQRWNCVRFFVYADGVRNLHAVHSRAGTLWQQLGLALAIDLAAGGDGEYTVENNLFWPRDGLAYRPLDWRVPNGMAEIMYRRSGGPALGTQKFFLSRAPYCQIRCAQLKRMKIVVVTRSILASLESRFFKSAVASERTGVTLDRENSFDWDRHLEYMIAFFNSWGDVLTWHPAIRHYRYEDLKADPVGAHKDMLHFWGFDVPEDCVAEGFRRVSKKEMLKRTPPDQCQGDIRVSDRGPDQRGIISDPRKRHIVDRLKRELIYDFGYRFEYDADYGVAYD